MAMLEGASQGDEGEKRAFDSVAFDGLFQALEHVRITDPRDSRRERPLKRPKENRGRRSGDGTHLAREPDLFHLTGLSQTQLDPDAVATEGIDLLEGEMGLYDPPKLVWVSGMLEDLV